MADNRVVHTNLYCSVFVKFAENIGGLIQFTVLDADVPMILGLPFLKRFNPLINWQKSTLQFLSSASADTTDYKSDASLFDDIVAVGGLHACIDALQLTCKRGLRVLSLHCPKCKFAHLDTGSNIRKHRLHECLQCKHVFKSSQYGCGNPLAYFLSNATEKTREDAAKTLVELMSLDSCGPGAELQCPHDGSSPHVGGLQHTGLWHSGACLDPCSTLAECKGASLEPVMHLAPPNSFALLPLEDTDAHMALRHSVLDDSSLWCAPVRPGTRPTRLGTCMQRGKVDKNVQVALVHCPQQKGDDQAKPEHSSHLQGGKPLVQNASIDFACEETIPCNVDGGGTNFEELQEQTSVETASFNKLVQEKKASIMEISLKSFKRDLKRNDFHEAFYCFSRELVDDAKCAFTHRTAHGTYGAGDKQLGDYARETLESLKQDFPTVFTEPNFPAVRGATEQHHIKLKDEGADPPRKKLYPLDNVELAALKEQLDSLLASGRIVHSASPYGAPILFAKKKDGKLRMCIDYRALNANTITDRYPLPRIDELLGRLKGATVFSKLDLRDGYHQIPLNPADAFKTAFCTRYGQFEFTVMPFGLCNAPATFQRVMNRMFFDLLDKCVLVYLDDILIFSSSVQQHKHDLQTVFKRLNEWNFRLKESKCALFLESVEFLGHTISANGVCVEQGKVEAISNWPVPKNLNEVQQFLGLCNYYRRFIKNFSTIALPLSNLTKKSTPFAWTTLQQNAFERLQHCLTAAPCLLVFDPARKTRVVCDASGDCVGSVLEQLGPDDQWHPVEFFSKRMNNAQSNYSATEQEMLAVILSLTRWRQHLIGSEFEILTDHASLTYLQNQSRLSRRQAHWMDFLAQFNMKFVHVPGKQNVVADALSQMPKTHGSSEQQQLATVISLNDESHVLDVLRRAQASSHDEWFLNTKQRCTDTSVNFALRNGVVCKLIKDHYAPVVPPNDHDLKHVIMLELHSSALGGHLSVAKMHTALKSRFYWPRMHQDVVRFCRECPVCQTQRTSTQAPYGLLQPHDVPSRPFEHVSMDFVVGLPPTARGSDTILVMVDRFSKYVVTIPCSDTSSATDVAKLFFDNIVCKFGMPSKLISDRDVRFTSLFWQSLVKLMGCKLNMSSAYHPQTDGQTERFNRSMEQVLRCYCSPRQEDWDLFLPQVCFALNSTIHQGTRQSAFTTLYGFEPTLPIDTALASLQDNKVQSVDDFVLQRRQVQQQVQQNLHNYSESMRAQANKHRRDISLQIGDLVYLSTGNLKLPPELSRKLAPRWIGPFAIEKVISPVAYKLSLPAEYGRLHPVFHVSLLKPHNGPVPIARAPLPVPGTDEVEFEVDRIVGKRHSRNRVEYLVQWKGYGPYDATWEPADNLRNAPQAVSDFEKHGLPRKQSNRS